MSARENIAKNITEQLENMTNPAPGLVSRVFFDKCTELQDREWFCEISKNRNMKSKRAEKRSEVHKWLKRERIRWSADKNDEYQAHFGT